MVMRRVAAVVSSSRALKWASRASKMFSPLAAIVREKRASNGMSQMANSVTANYRQTVDFLYHQAT